MYMRLHAPMTSIYLASKNQFTVTGIITRSQKKYMTPTYVHTQTVLACNYKRGAGYKRLDVRLLAALVMIMGGTANCRRKSFVFRSYIKLARDAQDSCTVGDASFKMAADSVGVQFAVILPTITWNSAIELIGWFLLLESGLGPMTTLTEAIFWCI